MAQWLWNNKQSEYDMIFVFANTGDENEETLDFVNKCECYFGFDIIWVEGIVHHGKRKGSSHKVVNYKTANRSGTPFENMVSKYGIPNSAYPHCTRELKSNPIASYARSIGWQDHQIAIGIRIDEIDRINPERKELHLIYPLIEKKMTKPKINFWWSQQPFRLQLKEYQGNCKVCWKKHDPKLFQISKESISSFDTFSRIEKKYEKYIPDTRLKLMKERGEEPKYPVRFFRKNRSVNDIIEEGKLPQKDIVNDADEYDSESCEVFTQCGDE